MILKMLLVAYLYDLSEHRTQVVADDSLSVKWFLRLPLDEPAPDHSTLARFENRLVEGGKLEPAEALLAQAQGIAFGSIQVMDSVHTVANDSTQKERERQDRAEEPPRDGDARWGAKGPRRLQDA